MPKVVDHAERRHRIARALWAVVARGGFEAASARAVAAQGGWSLGSVRHYFSSQDELVEFAARELIDGAAVRVETIYLSTPAGRTRCLRVLEELLPLDEVREGEVRSWLAILAKAQLTPALRQLRDTGVAAERHLCRMVVAELTRHRLPSLHEQLPGELEADAIELHAVVGGLCIQLVAAPRLTSAESAQRALRRRVRRIAGGEATSRVGARAGARVGPRGLPSGGP